MNGIRNLGKWLRRQYNRRPKPLWMLIAMDLLLIAASLLVFALFHHVLPSRGSSTGIVSNRNAAGGGASLIAVNDADEVYEDTGEVVDMDLSAMTSTGVSFSGGADDAAGAMADARQPAADTAAQDAATTAASTDAAGQSASAGTEELEYNGLERNYTVEEFTGVSAAPPGYFGEKYADKFTNGEVLVSNSGYQSANVNITLTQYESNNVTFYVSDIYIKDISCFTTAFAKDTFGKGIRESTKAISKRIGGVIAINGDYYGARDDGIVIRNGELFRSDKYPIRDVCVLFWDGSMETYSAKIFDAEAAINAGAYQAWNFGPRLLDENGKAKTTFNSDVGPANPRTVLGYYDPGHYCFVAVNGRTKNSKGLTLKELAVLMEQLGCKRAYNMDGGNTSVMVAGGTTVNNPSGGGRDTSDIVAIVDK